MPYFSLTKPRLALGNVIVGGAAFVFASRGIAFSWPDFLWSMTGLFLIIGSACVFNNIHDRHMDARMARTMTRPLPLGRVRVRSAALFGMALFVCALALLWQTNALALGAGLGGFVVYVFVYTPLKPKTPWAFFAGALSGAMPPLVGYAAAAGTFDWWALGLFLFMFIWQAPHFWAIARYRYEEYAAAGVPLFVKQPQTESERRRARRVFHASLVALALFCAILFV